MADSDSTAVPTWSILTSEEVVSMPVMAHPQPPSVRQVWMLAHRFQTGEHFLASGWRVETPDCVVVVYRRAQWDAGIRADSWDTDYGENASRWHDSPEAARAAIVARLRERHAAELKAVEGG